MLFIEFQTNINSSEENILKYRNVDDDEWHYMYIDIETLNLLVTNFGVISTYKIPTKYTNADNETTSKEVRIKYCGADITMKCKCRNVTEFRSSKLEQNY